MGNQNKPISKQGEKNDENYPPCIHPKFANAKTIVSQNQQLYQVTQSISSISAYHMWENRLNQLKERIGPNSLYLPLDCTYQQQGMCGTAGILKFRFQRYPYLLSQEIQNRQIQNLQFQDRQVWFLLYILSQTAASLHANEQIIGDIRPNNIFINEVGDISIFSSFASPQQFTNYQKTSYFNQITYLPPEGVNDFKCGKQTPSYDQKAGQSFSIGLTILDAIFLTDHSVLYEKMLRFNDVAFKQILFKLQKSKINQNLKNILLLMLSLNPENRLTCQQVYQYLRPYEKLIFQLEQFQIHEQLKKKSAQIQPDQRNQQNLHSSQQYDSFPTKQGETKSFKSKRQSLSRPISINNSGKKNQERNNNDIQNGKIENNKNGSQMLHFSIQNQSPEKVDERYKRQAQLSNTQNINSINQNIHNTSNQILKKQQNEINQFNEIQKMNIEKTEAQNRDIYNFPKPNNYIQLQQKKIGKLQLKNSAPYFCEPPLSNQEQNLTFKTGNLFKMGRNAHSIHPNQNIEGLKKPNLYNKLGQVKLQNKKIDNNQINSLEDKNRETTVNYKNEYEPISYKPSFYAPKLQFSQPQYGSSSYSDFLKNIDKQLEQSRKMFPDTYK